MNRSNTAVTSPARARRGTYFFLSYAHSAPMSSDVRTDADPWVRACFNDLSAAVARRARPAAHLDIGFFDQLVPAGSDWKAVLADALGGAEVFVPLYSPGYFQKSWPMRERESFFGRLTSSGAVETQRHMMPVLWTPLPLWDETAEIREAIRLGDGTPEYAEDGLRALCMLSSYQSYHDRYTLILDRLARRIVDVAENFPLGPSSAPALDDVSVDFSTAAQFLVVVVAPSPLDLPPHRSARGYADSGTRWRPFGEGQVLPIAEYAANTAERLGFPTRIVDLAEADDLLSSSPAVLLIDPWIAATPSGARRLESTARRLPTWALPLLVVDKNDPQYGQGGAGLADAVSDMLIKVEVAPPRRAREVEEFVRIMPGLITEARRRYLKKAHVFPPTGPRRKRPRLIDRTSLEPPEKADEL
jgi:FxsC-like protein